MVNSENVVFTNIYRLVKTEDSNPSHFLEIQFPTKLETFSAPLNI